MTYDENHYPRNKKSMNIFSSELQSRNGILLPMTPRQSTTQVQARQSINVRGTFMCADRIEERVDVSYLDSRLDTTALDGYRQGRNITSPTFRKQPK